MEKIIGLLAAFIILNCSNTVFAQITYSPYTINGIGDISNTGFSNNFGMGDVGIATPTFWHINSQNRALLVNNTLSVFQMGVAGESRTIETEELSYENGNAGIKYLAFAFPVISSKWSTSFGILPYSTVSYNTISSGTIEGTSVPVNFNSIGSGGLSRAYFANGFSLFKKINVGISFSYIFGLVENETITDIGDASFRAPFRTAIFEKTEYTGLKLKGGVAYRHELSETSFLNFGLIYETKSDLDAERFVRLERRTAADVSIPGDTLSLAEAGIFQSPSQFGFGFSWEKPNKIVIALDVNRNSWKKNPEFGSNSTEYQSTLSLGFGIEYIPDFKSVSSYFNRIRYRFGASYEEIPYLVQSKNISDFGINFGWSLPVGFSSLDMGFKYGQRGTTADNLIKERYFKFVLGATINDRWFIRRKYD